MPGEKKERWVTIKIKESTYKALLRTKALYELQMEQRISIDYVLNTWISTLPKIDLKLAELKPQAPLR